MLTFGRFVVSLFLLVCLFVVAWSFKFTPGPDQDSGSVATVDVDRDAGSKTDVGVAPGGWPSAKSENGESGTRKKSLKNLPSLWQTPTENPADIAIVDPLVDTNQKSQRNFDIPDRINNAENANDVKNPNPNPLNSNFADNLPEPPPLVGDAVDASEKTTKLNSSSSDSMVEVQGSPKQLTLPEIPNLIPSQDDLKSTTATNQLRPGHQPNAEQLSQITLKPKSNWRDPNAPPVPEGYAEPAGNPTFDATKSVLEKNQHPRISTNDPANTSQRFNPTASNFEIGTLVVVKRENPTANKNARTPIGYIKHVCQANDSLPALAEKYLGDKSHYMDIYRANAKQLQRPTAIPQGTVLKIPVY